MQLKDFIPPIVVKLARRSKQSQKTYNSYEEAQSICESGYEDGDLANVVYEKTRIYRETLTKQNPFVAEINSLRTLIGLSLANHGNELNVIDFGGACGAHYFIAKVVFGERLKLRWHVVETPNMASKAVALEDGQLKFFSDLQKARCDFDRVDLVFSSGALQYVPQPYKFLEQLIECGADNIFITRVGLSTSSRELVVVQESNLSANGPGPMPNGMRDRIAQYPVTFARKDKFEEIISQRYSIDILFEEDKGSYQAANQPIDMYGYFGTLKRGT
jgi:putative methyltransferase (TIGR04325 family)